MRGIPNGQMDKDGSKTRGQKQTQVNEDESNETLVLLVAKNHVKELAQRLLPRSEYNATSIAQLLFHYLAHFGVFQKFACISKTNSSSSWNLVFFFKFVIKNI